MTSSFTVAAGAGSLRSSVREDAAFPHAWSAEGVAVETQFTGAHLLHLAVAGCVLNDLYREAAAVALALRGVRVSATGEFDPSTWQSTGIAYTVQVDADAGDSAIEDLIARVDAVAEIPRALRRSAPVERVQ